jgi:hypothetical protein
MTATQPTLDDLLVALKPLAPDEFSRLVIEGARHALVATGNPLRLNFFSTATRILFEHMMDTLAPLDQVMRSPWFKPEKSDGKPTRDQRIGFAVKGGLDDAFVKDKLGVDVAPLRRKLTKAVDALSKHVHGREYTVVLDVAKQDTEALATIEALGNFLKIYHDCRSAILEPIQEELDDAAVNSFISDTLIEVDELATHHSVEEVYVEQTIVKAIGPDTITYQAKGSISVVLQWGSNSDLARGDGAELPQSFPIECTFEVPLEDPWELSDAKTIYGVDTSKWRDAMGPDDEE